MGEDASPQPAASPDRERYKVSAERLCKAANIGDFGLRKGAAGQKRKPDAGASAGDKSLARPAARQGSERLDIGRQAYPGAKDAEGSPDASRARGVHALVRVGSAAMPAPFALGIAACRPLPRRPETSARATPSRSPPDPLLPAAPQRASPQIAGESAPECPSAATGRCAGLLFARSAT